MRHIGRLMRGLIDNRLVLRVVEVIDGRSDNRMSERGMLNQAFEFTAINRVQGDYFEFGLWKGKTFRYAHRAKRRYHQENTLLWGFDSFQGLPATSEKENNVWFEGEFQCSERNLRKILMQSGFRNDEYVLIPGYYHESLNDTLHERLSGRKAAIVYVDCDLYESTIQVLNFIHRYLLNGSIVCFDDYYMFKGAIDQGEQRALNEFLEKHTDVEFIPYFDYSPVGKSFIVRR